MPLEVAQHEEPAATSWRPPHGPEHAFTTSGMEMSSLHIHSEGEKADCIVCPDGVLRSLQLLLKQCCADVLACIAGAPVPQAGRFPLCTDLLVRSGFPAPRRRTCCGAVDEGVDLVALFNPCQRPRGATGGWRATRSRPHVFLCSDDPRDRSRRD